MNKQQRYERTPKGKAARARYQKSAKGHEALKRYRESLNGQIMRRLWWNREDVRLRNRIRMQEQRSGNTRGSL